MTATAQPTSRPAGTAAQSHGPVVAGAPGAPQVNLLPPEVRASRSLQATKRVLVLAVVATVVLAGGGFVTAQMQLSDARSELAREQAETQRLLAEQARYAEVPQVLGRLERARRAQELGTASEVLWAPYMQQLMLTAPEGVVFTGIAVAGATPMQPAPSPAHPLERVSEYRLTFAGRTLTLPDVAAWMEALDSIEGFQDSYVTVAELGLGAGSWSEIPSYEVNGSVQITGEALALRFAPQQEED